MSDLSLLAIAFDAISDPVLVHDKDFRVLCVNRALAQHLGYNAATLQGQKISGVLPCSEPHWERCPYCEGAAGDGETLDAAFGGYLLATNSSFFDPGSGSLGTVHVLKDMSARRQAEEKYRLLFENVQESVFISTPEGRLLDFNDAFQRMLGFENRTELMGVDLARLYVHADDRDRLKNFLSRNGAVTDYEFQVRRRDGQIIIVTESSIAIRDESGSVVSYQGFILDVTERRRAEQELLRRNAQLTALHEETQAACENLRRTQEQLLQSEKMAAVGQLISGVAHELNNPLTAILGYSQLLADGQDVTPRGADFLHKIYKQAQRTHRIVQNLLSFARQQKPRRLPVDLNHIIDDTIVLREYDLRLNNISVHRKFAANLPHTVGDLHQLQQVFLNILNNAVDAILENAGQGEIWVRTRFENGRIFAEFADSGPGVKDPARVFDPFYTTKPVGKGTGLGLSICYGIVKEHGGEIRAFNAPPRGAVFEVSLPVSTVALSEPAGAAPVCQEAARGARLLLVDDEEAILDLEREILSTQNCRTFAVRSGREAVAFLERQTVDLVITDVKMPGDISGRDLYRWIELHRPELSTHVIFTMSDTDTEAAQNLLKRTGCPCMQKPFPVDEFLRAVQQALGLAAVPNATDSTAVSLK